MPMPPEVFCLRFNDPKFCVRFKCAISFRELIFPLGHSNWHGSTNNIWHITYIIKGLVTFSYITSAVILQPFKTETRIRTQFVRVELSGKKIETEKGFFPCTPVFSSLFHSINITYSYFIQLPQTLWNTRNYQCRLIQRLCHFIQMVAVEYLGLCCPCTTTLNTADIYFQP